MLRRLSPNLRILVYVVFAQAALFGLMVLWIASAHTWHDHRWPHVRTQLEAILPTMDPLLAALERYRSDHGRYPQAMAALVPRYLTAIPHLPPPMPEEFYYHTLADSDRQAFEIRTHLLGRYNPWPPLTPRFTVLCYRSGEVYPPVLYDDKLVGRVGRWAYYYD